MFYGQYALNNPVLHTDPSGHCIPGIGDCRYTGQINWADGAAYATGVSQGVLNVVTSVVMAPVAVAEAIANPNAAIAGVQQQFATVAAGADVLVNDPAQAAAIINDNPNAIARLWVRCWRLQRWPRLVVRVVASRVARVVAVVSLLTRQY
jgi:hypothetical protein